MRADTVNRITRALRNVLFIVGVCLMVGGTATQSVSAAIIVLGTLCTAGAVTGMWLKRG